MSDLHPDCLLVLPTDKLLYIDACEDWCQQVDASISKGFIRIAGTAVGGGLAYVVTLKPVLATRSVPLAAILLVITFLAGLAGQTQFKVLPSPVQRLYQGLVWSCFLKVLLSSSSTAQVLLA